jgi:hypothetical protein
VWVVVAVVVVVFVSSLVWLVRELERTGTDRPLGMTTTSSGE